MIARDAISLLVCLQLDRVVLPATVPAIPAGAVSSRLSRALRSLGLSLSGLKVALGRPAAVRGWKSYRDGCGGSDASEGDE